LCAQTPLFCKNLNRNNHGTIFSKKRFFYNQNLLLARLGGGSILFQIVRHKQEKNAESLKKTMSRPLLADYDSEDDHFILEPPHQSPSPSPPCMHEFLEDWSAEGWHCGSCKVLIKNTQRISDEEVEKERILTEDATAFRGDVEALTIKNKTFTQQHTSNK